MCDCLVALPHTTAHGGTLFAKNADRDPNESIGIRHERPRRDREPITCTYIDVEAHHDDTLECLLVAPDWMWGAEMGVNEAGVVIGNARIFTTLDPRKYPPALTGMDLLRLGLERADTAHRAVETIVELIDRYGQGGSGHQTNDQPYWSSFLLADQREAWVLETSGRICATHKIDDTWATSNRTTIPSFDDAHRHPRQTVETHVDPRLNASRHVLAAQPIAVDAIRAHLASHNSGPFSVCIHVDEKGHEQRTTASMIVTLPPPRTPLTPESIDTQITLGSPCTSSFAQSILSVDTT